MDKLAIYAWIPTHDPFAYQEKHKAAMEVRDECFWTMLVVLSNLYVVAVQAKEVNR